MSKKVEGGAQILGGAGIVYTGYYLKDLAGEFFDKIKDFPVSDQKISAELLALCETLIALGVAVAGAIVIINGLINLFSSEEEN
jgi:hypothetical protein